MRIAGRPDLKLQTVRDGSYGRVLGFEDEHAPWAESCADVRDSHFRLFDHIVAAAELIDELAAWRVEPLISRSMETRREQ